MSKIIIFALAIFFFSLPPVSRAGEIEQLKEALGSASGKREQALIYKKMGDYHSSQGDFKSAAGHYERALALDRQGFPAESRVTMANRISWGGGRDRAEEELRSVLSDEPANNGALISLARVVSWSGRLDPALKEIEKALKAEPGSREALLVKANILRWKGKNRDAEAVYKKILEGGEDFDARLGLAYAQLAEDDRIGSRENAMALKPSTAYQEGQLREYNEAAAGAGDRAEARTGYYSDSDFNRVKRYSLGGAFRTGGVKADLSYSETVANDGVRDNRVDAISLSASSRVGEFTASGGVTLSKTAGDGGTSFLTGYVKTDFNIDDSSVSVAARREFLTDTALLIENGIRATVLSLSLSRPLSGRLRLYGGAAYRRYSDDNSAVDLQIAPVYTLISKDPRLSVGYRLRYLDYERQSRGGYFDPFNFLSNQVFAALSFERGGFYARMEPYIGYQSHRRYESNESHSFMGALAGAGFKPAKGLDIEASVEGGNYALGTSAGFRYYLLGLRLTYAPS